ncbi:MAG: helix-turn-helix transcriptional regulator [Tissierellia bacterium]|jgi:transcriptional regulator with XRE-family HTH domain|nr:helix-turn-helix transcriptional regulator [Tissierellia bacterium]
MNTFNFVKRSPIEINKLIAARIRDIRKRKKISQEKLSEKSGVSLGSVKRFESSGEISLISLTKIAIALNCENELERLFEDTPFESIDEVINGQGK